MSLTKLSKQSIKSSRLIDRMVQLTQSSQLDKDSNKSILGAHVQSIFNGSNTFGTMKISSRQG